jgi:hypothetical protein
MTKIGQFSHAYALPACHFRKWWHDVALGSRCPLQIMSKEQRQAPRHPLNQSGELHFPGKGRLRVKVQDIAMTGAGVLSDITIPVGARGELLVSLIGPSPAKFVAGFAVTDVSLAGMHGYRIGLDFDPLSEEMQAALHTFVSSRKVGRLVRPD